MLNSPFSVYVEEAAMSLDESMNAIRSWLDHNKIQPIELNTTTRQAYRPLPLQHRHRSAQPLHARTAREKQCYRRPPGARPYREHAEGEWEGWAPAVCSFPRPHKETAVHRWKRGAAVSPL
jgi:hypothetical protein